MIRSMTGHGQAVVENSEVRVRSEIRSVNNRFLKINIHTDLDYSHQAQMESLIKQHCTRGSVNLKIKFQKIQDASDFQINEPVLRSYWLQLSEIAEGSQAINVEALLALPGVVQDSLGEDEEESIWPCVRKAVTQSLEKLTEMRTLEGEAMHSDLVANCENIANELQKIVQLAPTVIENYSQKITERINGLLEKHNVAVAPVDVIREVGLFAERVDISEETVRLESHLRQFRSILKAEGSNGKKLDFIVQEMLRETNTIGSKANDAQIASRVVSIKSSIERIREMVQNVE